MTLLALLAVSASAAPLRLAPAARAVGAFRAPVAAPALAAARRTPDALTLANVALLREAHRARRAARPDDQAHVAGIPRAVQERAGLAGLPRVALRRVLSTRGTNSVLLEGELQAGGAPARVAVKMMAARRRPIGDGYEKEIEAFRREEDYTRRMVATLPRGWAARSFDAVDADGNPALAFEVIKGKDVGELTPRELALLTPERVKEAMAGVQLLRLAGLMGCDSPQLMMLTEDQVLNGVQRRRGDLVFMDAANVSDESENALTPQTVASNIRVFQLVGERFLATDPDVPVSTLQKRLSGGELLQVALAAVKQTKDLPTPDPLPYLR